MDTSKEILAAAGALGSYGMILVPGFNAQQPSIPFVEARAMLIDQLKELGEFALQHKTALSDIAPKAGTFTIGEKTFGNDFEFVLRDLDKVIELEPNFIYAYYNRGNIRCLQRDYRNALLDYSKALDINPDFAEAWYNRGITQIYLGDRDHGLADLRMAGQLGLYKAYNIIKRLGD